MQESAVVHNGHRLAISLASRNFTPANHLQEIWGGIHQLHTIKRVETETTHGDIQRLTESLQAIGNTIFYRDNMMLALIGEEAMLAKERAEARLKVLDLMDR